MGWFLAVLGIFLGVVIYLGNHFTKLALYPKVRTREDALSREVGFGHFTVEAFENMSKEEVVIDTPRGYTLKGYWIPSHQGKGAVVFAHGITYNLFGSVKYMQMFQKWGFDVMIYDHRNHGESGGGPTTFGYYEKLDLRCVIDFVQKRVGPNVPIGTHGESMGAATVIQHAAIDKRVAFVIADCSFATAWDEFAYRMKVDNGLPAFPILHAASMVSRLRYGVWFSQMSPLKAIEHIEAPMLFFHGESDDYIPLEHTVALYEAKADKKMLVTVPAAKHAKSYQEDPDNYEQSVWSFLKDFGFVKEEV